MNRPGIVNSVPQTCSETLIEKQLGPIPDGSNSATVNLLVVVLGFTQEENVCNGVAVSNVRSLLKEGKACTPVPSGRNCLQKSPFLIMIFVINETSRNNSIVCKEFRQLNLRRNRKIDGQTRKVKQGLPSLRLPSTLS